LVHKGCCSSLQLQNLSRWAWHPSDGQPWAIWREFITLTPGGSVRLQTSLLLLGDSLSQAKKEKSAMAKILVIDDEESIRSLLDRLLVRKGYDVVIASNGRKGLEFFRREHPDAVLLDLKMPEMDGLMVLKEIRNIDQKLPVIVLTGAGTPEVEQQAHALGATEFVEKEFSLHHLGDSLKRHLNTSAKR